MNIRKIYGLLLSAALIVLAACTADDATGPIEEGGGEGAVTQKIHFVVGGVSPSDIYTRLVPPGEEGELIGASDATCNVDKIRLLVFRRAEGSDGSFVYDETNSTDADRNKKILEVSEDKEITGEDGATIAHGRTAEGSILKKKGYEYRVIALGYNSQRDLDLDYTDHDEFKIFTKEETGFDKDNVVDESTLFRIVTNIKLDPSNPNDPIEQETLIDGESRFEDLYLQIKPMPLADRAGAIAATERNQNTKRFITGWYQLVPEIFYGTCKTVEGSDIITFDDENTLTGYLYRGVAKLEVDIVNLKSGIANGLYDGRLYNHVCTMALVGDSIRQAVRLSDYDEFKTPIFKFGGSNYDLPGFGENANDGTSATHTAIAIDGKLANDLYDQKKDMKCHEYEDEEITFVTYLLPTQTRLYLRTWSAWMPSLDSSHHNYNDVHERRFTLKSQSNGNQATGVIDPITGGEFIYFRRNQSYKIEVDGKDLAKIPTLQ